MSTRRLPTRRVRGDRCSTCTVTSPPHASIKRGLKWPWPRSHHAWLFVGGGGRESIDAAVSGHGNATPGSPQVAGYHSGPRRPTASAGQPHGAHECWQGHPIVGLGWRTTARTRRCSPSGVAARGCAQRALDSPPPSIGNLPSSARRYRARTSSWRRRASGGAATLSGVWTKTVGVAEKSRP